MKLFLKKAIVYILTLEARLVLRKYKPQIVAVTGTVGKTSTKDAIFTVFSKNFYTRKSFKSFNSEIGIPLAILGCPNAWNNPLLWLKNFLEGLTLILMPNHYPKWLILEIGADRPRDIEKISRWLKIDVAVFTKMSSVPVHVEFFDSAKAVFEEKMQLLKALRPGGVIIYNYDDQIIRNYLNEIRHFRRVSYGFDKKAEITASHYKIIYSKDEGAPKPLGVNFKVSHIQSSLPSNLKGTLGRHQIYPLLVALAAALSQGVNLVKIIEYLEDHVPPPGRMKILDGVKNTVIIDDSYNSSPIALAEAMSVLAELKITGRKIAVLGDMLELGKYAIEEHKKIGHIAGGIVDFLFTVGIRARYIAEEAQKAGLPEDRIFEYEADESRLAGKRLEILLEDGDAVLVKGSQGVRLEKVVEEVMADPMKKEELLVRQEEKWKSR